jgi:predicted dehydrogenase
MKKIKVGIVGCGGIANRKHFLSISRQPDVEMVAFCDIIIERAQAAAERYGPPDALVCEDYHDLTAREDIDVVHVCTPNSSHAEITIAALNAGKHVLCEKPMAKTAAEAKAMLDASRETGKLLTIGYQNRYRPNAQFLKKVVDNGDLGDIYFGKALGTRRRGVPTHGVFLDKSKQGGGPLIDLATHTLDLALWMMDNYEPTTVLGSTFNKLGKIGSGANIMGPWDPDKFEVEDSGFGLVKFKNGATVIVESSWALNQVIAQQDAVVVLCGTKAGADMFPETGPGILTRDFDRDRNFPVRVNGENNGKLYIQNYALGGSFISSGEKPEFYPGMYKEQEVWYNAVRNGGELVIKPEQAYTVTLILEAIYESSNRGDVVHIDELQAVPASR